MSQNERSKQEIIPTGKIRALLDAGVSNWKIRKSGVSPKRITQISRGESPKKRGRQPKFDEEHRDYVISLVKANPNLISSTIQELFRNRYGMRVSAGKVSEWIKYGNLFYGKPIVIQDLKDYQIIARYNFAIETLLRPPEFFDTITFSDESRFSTNPDSIRIYREKGSLDSKYCIQYTKFAPSCMVWGAIAKNFKSKIVFVGTLNADSYWKLLDDNDFFNQARTALGDEWYYQQDGAPCHTTKKVITRIIEKTHIVAGWPPNSPDLSPIEMCWSIIKYRINCYSIERRPKTVEELKDAVQREWDNISLDVINSLIDSFRTRLEMCIQVGGRSISHFLRQRCAKVPEKYVIPEASRPMRFTPELDAKLMLEYERCGRAWTLISKLDDVNIDPHLVKYRVLALMTKKEDAEMIRFNHKGIMNDSTNVEDDTSIQKVVDKLENRVPFPLEDPHGLNHHYIYDEPDHEDDAHTIIDIPRQDVELTDIVLSEDENDSYVTYSSSNGDIYFTEPNSSK